MQGGSGREKRLAPVSWGKYREWVIAAFGVWLPGEVLRLLVCDLVQYLGSDGV